MISTKARLLTTIFLVLAIVAFFDDDLGYTPTAVSYSMPSTVTNSAVE